MSEVNVDNPYDDIPPDPHAAESELTEEDLYRMKNLDRGAASTDNAEQSIISIADSASNFEDRLGEEFDDVDNIDDEEQQLGEDEKIESVVSGNYLFGKNRRNSHLLNKETVTILHYPDNVLYPQCPPDENPEEWEKLFHETTLYLIGTAHFSKESQDDVMRTIGRTQPDVVMVELCPGRVSILSMDEATLLREAKELNMEKIMTTIKQSGAVQGVLHVLLLSMSAHITRQLSMAPGGEFRAAHRAVQNIKLCRLILGDRPIQITLQRALGSLTFWQRLKFFWHVLMSHRTEITPEEVENCKKRDLLEELLAEMAGDFPSLSKIFVEERDDFMKLVLHKLMMSHTVEKRAAWRKLQNVPWEPVNIVAVVGIGHTLGITTRWDTLVDGEPLMTIPPPSVTGKVVKFTVKYAFYGAVGYLLFRGVTRAIRRFN
ncbi:unnamed protein product [Auanema sp. JU1783]|nr:unnamed protein product [Auanema sp. JU1783]